MNLKTILLLLCVLPMACSRVSPAGFWERYQKRFLMENRSDQGPNGGYRTMHWKAEAQQPFVPGNVLQFAADHDWTLTDSQFVDGAPTTGWKYQGKPVFPLSHDGFSGAVVSNATFESFPRWFDGPLKLYAFTTGWLTILPGTDSSIERNGFLLISEDGTEMAVYHLWGE